MAPFKRHELLAMATHDVIEGTYLRARGVSPENLDTMLRREHLFRAHRDVFFVTDRPSYRSRCWAAVRHCGDDALVSFLSAGALWELIDHAEGDPFVTVPAHRMTHGADGIDVRRSRRRDRGWTRDGIAVTTLNRTLDDVSRMLAPDTLTRAIGRAERKHVLDLEACFSEARSARLKRRLETYVAGRGLTDSELEARFLDIVATTSLDRPQMQRHQAGGRVDFVWPQLGLIVEVDGYDTHRGRVAFQTDKERDRANWRAGLDTLRYTWNDVVLTPREIAADLELARERVA